MKRFILLSVLACTLAAAAVAAAAGPKVPLQATYTGKNSTGKVTKIFVSKQGTRIGYTMHVKLPCANGGSIAGAYWTTEGEFAGKWWIKPRPNGTFGLASSNSGKYTGGTFRAWARFAGRFTSSSVTAGTFRGHIDYYKADGSLLTKCDTGAVTWTAKR